MFKLLIFIFLGSGLGGVCRYLSTKGIEKIIALSNIPAAISIFPWGTMLVNITGSFIIGLIYGLVAKGTDIPAETKTFLTVGFCGGLTTFSTFSHENLLLFNDGRILTVILYAGASLTLGLLAAWLGHSAA